MASKAATFDNASLPGTAIYSAYGDAYQCATLNGYWNTHSPGVSARKTVCSDRRMGKLVSLWQKKVKKKDSPLSSSTQESAAGLVRQYRADLKDVSNKCLCLKARQHDKFHSSFHNFQQHWINITRLNLLLLSSNLCRPSPNNTAIC